MAVQLEQAKNRLRQDIEDALQREQEYHKEKYVQPELKPDLQVGAKVTMDETTNRILPKEQVNNRLPKPSMGNFLKMYGKNTTKSKQNNSTFQEPEFTPARIFVEPGKSPRNGYISTEDKMKQDIEECHKREEELKK